MKKQPILPLIALFALCVSASPVHAEESVSFIGSANVSYPVIVALEKGYFAAEGLDVKIELVQVSKQAMESLLAGRADMGSIVSTNVAYAGFQTNDLRIIASYGLSLDDAVVVPEESLITSAGDLMGKKIGLVPSTTSQAFLIGLLELEGLTWKDIVPVPLQPAAGLPALKGGQIDAFVTWQPWRAGIAKAFDGKVREINNNENIYPRRDLLASTKEYLEHHADVPGKFLRALIKAEEFIDEHHEEAIDIVTKKTGQDREAVGTYVKTPYISLNSDIRPLIESYAEWVAAHQEDFLNKPIPEYSKNFAPEYLKAVAPERIVGNIK